MFEFPRPEKRREEKKKSQNVSLIKQLLEENFILNIVSFLRINIGLLMSTTLTIGLKVYLSFF